jgi:hypothetical protein
MSKWKYLLISGGFVLAASSASYADVPGKAWTDCTQNLAYNRTDWDGIIRGCSQVLESGITGNWRTEALRQRAIAYEHKGEFGRAKADRDAAAQAIAPPLPQATSVCSDWLRQQGLPQLGCSPEAIEQICAGLRPVPTTPSCGGTEQPAANMGDWCQTTIGGCDVPWASLGSTCQCPSPAGYFQGLIRRR